MLGKKFEFNIDDFLSSEASRKAFQKEHSEIYFALFNSYISDEFAKRDAAANQAKRNLQIYGLPTILFGFLSISLAAYDIALLAPLKDPTEKQELLKTTVPVLAAVLGMVSFAIGFWGAGIGSKKIGG